MHGHYGSHGSRPWLIYALGGGWGHLTRALAFARLAARRVPVRVMTNSSCVQTVLESAAFRKEAAALDLQVWSLPAGWGREQVARRIEELLACEWEVLLVDSFPRGLGGELAPMLEGRTYAGSGLRVLVHRDLAPEYVRAAALEDYVRAHYDLVLVPGEASAPLAHLGVYTAPWLVRDPTELPARAVLRQRLGLTAAQPTVVVVAAGRTDEAGFWGAIAARIAAACPGLAVRCLAAACPPACPPELWVSHWPGIEVLAAADVAVGGGGYHTVHECAALGLPLVACARPRLYDRQTIRLNTGRPSVSPLAAHLSQLLGLPALSFARCGNGAPEAIRWVERVKDMSSARDSP